MVMIMLKSGGDDAGLGGDCFVPQKCDHTDEGVSFSLFVMTP